MSPLRKALLFLSVELLPALGAAACLWLWWTRGVHALDLLLLAVMYVLAILGVELGLHRYFSHRSFTATPGLTRALVLLGSLAGQGPVLLWTAMHRTHHANTDEVGDPHSPLVADGRPRSALSRALWAQFLWYLDRPEIVTWRARAEGTAPFDQLTSDWRRVPGLLAWNRAYWPTFFAGFALPALVGGLVSGSDGALRGLLAGGFLRHFLVTQSIYGVNTVCHLWGSRPHATRDGSRNNAIMAWLTLGAGWHNTHHAFPGSARLDEHGWQVDPTGWVIRALARAGLVTAVHGLPARGR
ncbi:MAG: acyl-CoA desaturase [Deltaproteobacteria bacterium]|nr:acyl-CoA desaturase [Deltaproteobacteria bacterium]